MKKVDAARRLLESDPVLMDLLHDVQGPERRSARWIAAYLAHVAASDPTVAKHPGYNKAMPVLLEAAKEQEISDKISRVYHDPHLVQLAGGEARMQYYFEHPEEARKALADLQQRDPAAYRMPIVQEALGTIVEATSYIGSATADQGDRGEEFTDSDPEVDAAVAAWREGSAPQQQSGTPPAPKSAVPPAGSARAELDRLMAVQQSDYSTYKTAEFQARLGEVALAAKAERTAAAAPAPSAPAATPNTTPTPGQGGEQ